MNLRSLTTLFSQVNGVWAINERIEASREIVYICVTLPHQKRPFKNNASRPQLLIFCALSMNTWIGPSTLFFSFQKRAQKTSRKSTTEMGFFRRISYTLVFILLTRREIASRGKFTFWANSIHVGNPRVPHAPLPLPFADMLLNRANCSSCNVFLLMDSTFLHHEYLKYTSFVPLCCCQLTNFL